MNPHPPQGLRPFLFRLRCICDYSGAVVQLEKALARKPPRFQLDLIGCGELSPDMALVVRSVLLGRSPETHLITHARSSLQGGAVLIWLLGDTRWMREDAKVLFRKSSYPATPPTNDGWSDESSEETVPDMEEIDYAQVLQHINQYLPVNELAGRPLDRQLLRQYGLVDHEQVDQRLAALFARPAQRDAQAGQGSQPAIPAPRQPSPDPPGHTA